MLCDSVNVYLAKLEENLVKENNRSEHGLGHHVVSRLTSFIRNTSDGQWFILMWYCTCKQERLSSGIKKAKGCSRTGDFKIMQKRGYKCHNISMDGTKTRLHLVLPLGPRGHEH
ncbi:hypothetical protein MAR_019960 [Mya arenaria]|uniref:Uncharacterized protein n=1 Tax=Mya arenaria TaxID=6604 RepID=A0ABY7E7R9_MYAAR|nr:hypothetical protein MAR_019960 [Mya arenaria]